MPRKTSGDWAKIGLVGSVLDEGAGGGEYRMPQVVGRREVFSMGEGAALPTLGK